MIDIILFQNKKAVTSENIKKYLVFFSVLIIVIAFLKLASLTGKYTSQLK